jgi:DNA-binding HxlR family transcriptional regulator
MAVRVPLQAALQDAALAVLGSLSASAPERAARLAAESSRPAAPLAAALNRLQSRRRLLLTWHLFWGPRGFAELLLLTAGIPRRRLRQELQALEADGLVERQLSSGDPGRLEFALTPLGEALKPALASLYLWGLHVQGLSAKTRAPERRD